MAAVAALVLAASTAAALEIMPGRLSASWTVDEAANRIELALTTHDGAAWIGFGIGPGRAPVGADVLIFDDPDGAGFVVTDRWTDGTFDPVVDDDDEADIWTLLADATHDDGSRTIVVERPLVVASKGSSSAQDMSILPGPTAITVATGLTPEMAYHGPDCLQTTVTFYGSAPLIGVVFADRDGDGVRGDGEEAVAGAVVIAQSEETGALTERVHTDANGRFSIADVGEGRYRIGARKAGFTAIVEGVDLVDAGWRAAIPLS